MGLIKPAGGEGCPSGQRRGLAAPAEETFPSTGKKSFHISTTATTRGRTEKSPGSIPPHRVGKPQSHWPIADWLGLLEPAWARVAPRANAVVPPQLGRIRSHPQVRNLSISLQFQQPGAVQKKSRGSIPPHRVGKPQSHRPIADWLGFLESARGESGPSGQCCRSPAAGEDTFPSPGQKS